MCHSASQSRRLIEELQFAAKEKTSPRMGQLQPERRAVCELRTHPSRHRFSCRGFLRVVAKMRRVKA